MSGECGKLLETSNDNDKLQYGTITKTLNEEEHSTEQQTDTAGQPLRNPSAVIRTDGYVELMRGKVPCPTCRGNGSIPKEQENELVALIPVRDDRLKPRRTCLYVSVAIAVCLVTAGLLIFFMFPRDVKLSSNMKLLLPHNLTIDRENMFVSFFIVNPFNVTNSNYFAVKMLDATMSVVFSEKVLNTSKVSVQKNVDVRSQTSFSIPIGIEFNKKNGLAELVNDCAEPYIFYHRRVMYFSVTANYNFLGRDEETSLNVYSLVSCGNDTLNLQ
ncbi:transmembrane protein 106B-like [Ostrea edulis]|uniref:transmembrane protein 106B-like n=1 Tax=Ostrea edulis TaxID=37623 RepID=UPI0024AF44A5|nr:transmembrane protein 106B-like [Ostrea edulis]